MLSSYHNHCSRSFPPLGGPFLLASPPLKGSLFPHTTYSSATVFSKALHIAGVQKALGE